MEPSPVLLTLPVMNMLWPLALAETMRMSPSPVVLAPATVTSMAPQSVRKAPPWPAFSVKLLPPATLSVPKFVVWIGSASVPMEPWPVVVKT